LFSSIPRCATRVAKRDGMPTTFAACPFWQTQTPLPPVGTARYPALSPEGCRKHSTPAPRSAMLTGLGHCYIKL